MHSFNQIKMECLVTFFFIIFVPLMQKKKKTEKIITLHKELYTWLNLVHKKKKS